MKVISRIDELLGRRVLSSLFETERDAAETFDALERARSGSALDDAEREAIGRLLVRLDTIANQVSR